MTEPIAISVQGLSKRYRIGLREALDDSLIRSMARWISAPLRNYRRLRQLTHFDEAEEEGVLWALRDVSFDVPRGQVMGIVGRNGAGKSTFLKVLAAITEPTRGRVEINGEVASLLEVGTGFHPELTGRENIYLNGTILGLTKRQIDRRFDAIVDFAGIPGFLDTPVKRYSSGMRIRLAFSVAAHLDPEILLIDEVLAVGDSAFQRKCLGKMREVAGGGRTVLFVSHNLAAVRSLCTRCVLLDSGRLIMDDDTAEVLDHYIRSTLEAPTASLGARKDRSGSGALRVTELLTVDAAGEPVSSVLLGQPLHFLFRYESASDRPLTDVTFGMSFYDQLGALITTCWTEYTGESFSILPPRGEVACDIPKVSLMPGQYGVSIAIKVQGVVADRIDNALAINVLAGDYFGTGRTPKPRGTVMVDHHWSWRQGPR